MNKHIAIVAALLAGFALPPMDWSQAPAAAAHAAPRFAPVAPGEALANLDSAKARLKQYHECTCTCGCYTKDLDLEADRAIAFLNRRAAHRRPDEKLALVLDIDETTLSNWDEMVSADFAYNGGAFNAWVNSAKAPAIPGTLRLFQDAERLGVSVFFLTGRAEAVRAATERNLRSQGFDRWEQLILRAPQQAKASATEYKSAARAAIAARGYTLALNVGDQWSDLKGVPEAEYSVKYPDPFYFIP